MRSKVILCAAIAFIGLNACQKFTDNTPQNKSSEPGLSLAGSGELECISNVGDELSLSVKKVRTKNQVMKPFLCINSALGLFLKHTTGEKRDRYSAEELRDFAHRYLLVNQDSGQLETPISDGFLKAIMETKSALVGGDTKSLTRNEISRLGELVELLGDELSKLNPALVQTFGENSTTQVKSSAQFRKQLPLAAARLKQFMELHSSSYQLKSLENLIKEAVVFTDAGTVQDLLQYASVFKSIKTLFVSPGEEKIEKSEWPRVFDVVTSLADMGLRIAYELEFDLENKDTVFQLDGLAKDAISLLNAGVLIQDTQVITWHELSKLLSRLESADLLPDDMSAKMLATTAHTVLSKIFAGYTNTTANQIAGIGLSELHMFQQYFSEWSFTQKRVLNLDKPMPYANAKQLLLQDMVGSAEEQEAVRNFVRSLMTSQPVSLLGPDQFLIDLPESRDQANTRTLSLLNIVQIAYKLLHYGYVSKDEPIRANKFSGLKVEEVIEFYFDVRDFGIAIGIMDQRTTGMGKRIFYEADLLSYSANGNDLMEDREIGPVILNLIATGVNLHDRLLDDLYAKGCGIEKWTSMDGKPLLSLECLKAHQRELLTGSANHFPQLKSYLESLSKDEASKYVDNFFKTGRSSSSCPKGFEHTDVQQSLVIMTYAEIAFTRYDTNNDGLLNGREINVAFPVYESILGTVAPPGLSRFRMKILFRYLLKNGPLPEGLSDNELLAEVMRGASRVQVNRTDLLNAFVVIKDSLIGGGESEEEPWDPQKSCVEVH